MDARNTMLHKPYPHLIFVGNPGAGVVTILNSLLGGYFFQHWPVGIPLRTMHIAGSFYSDTPNLFRDSHRETAALQIASLLRSGTPCRLVFVCVLEENERPLSAVDKYAFSAEDIKLMRSVLQEAIAAGVDVAHRASLIVNQIHDANHEWLSNPLHRFSLEESLGRCSPLFMQCPISNFVYMPFVPAAAGRRKYIVRDFTRYRRWLGSAPIIQTHPTAKKPAASTPSPDVFISHAGLDKEDIGMPLHDKLVALGFRVFIDKIGLRPGDLGEDVMLNAMRTAHVGVFIASPEFAGRKWTLRELGAFLDRREQAEKIGRLEPAIIPVFYRLHVSQCSSERLYKPGEHTGRIIFDQGFFEEERQKEISTRTAVKYMKMLTKFTGIENDEEAKNDCMVPSAEDKKEHSSRRERLVDRIIASVEEHFKSLKGQGHSAADSLVTVDSATELELKDQEIVGAQTTRRAPALEHESSLLRSSGTIGDPPSMALQTIQLDQESEPMEISVLEASKFSDGG